MRFATSDELDATIRPRNRVDAFEQTVTGEALQHAETSFGSAGRRSDFINRTTSDETARPGDAARLPFPKLGTVGVAHLVLVIEVPGEFARLGIAIFRIAFQRAIDDFLQLGWNGGIDFAWHTPTPYIRSPMKAVRPIMAPEAMVEQVSAKASWKSQNARNATPVVRSPALPARRTSDNRSARCHG